MFKEDETQYCKNCYELQEQLDQLKAENEELKKQNNQFDNGINEQFSKIVELEGRNNLLKVILTEIKEVLQLYNNTTIGIDKGNGIFEFEVSNDNVLGGKLICYYDTNPAKKALQKISECEGNDETN